ncbi:hypothetical protein E3N88_14061 [Mikania micrantha]|uniref:Retrotransposon Copia-like N-terminal domain-containing protein n=1 Tax=Mikania micrantha TaxID=192012 RepID=A0A5N6P236_9ASTR|nr:hypothetical protein E3N88_14061 [Mikania micrantha]
MASSTTVITITASTHFNIKLTSQNFSVWRRHVQSVLIGLGLENFITGTTPAPPMTIIDTEAIQPNPAYVTWFRQNHASTAKDAWDRLTSSFASISRSRIISLKSKLAKNHKGTMPAHC